MYNTYTSRTIVINDFAIDCRVSHIGHAQRKWRAKSNDQGHDECVYSYNNILSYKHIIIITIRPCGRRSHNNTNSGIHVMNILGIYTIIYTYTRMHCRCTHSNNNNIIWWVNSKYRWFRTKRETRRRRER